MNNSKKVSTRACVLATIFVLISLQVGPSFILWVVGHSGLIDSDAKISVYVNKSRRIELSFRFPDVVKFGDYDLLEMENCSYVSIPGQPKLPIKTTVVKLPLKSVFEDIKVSVEWTFIKGSFSVVPAQKPIRLDLQSKDLKPETKLDHKVYESHDPYPTKWFDYRVCNGMDPETQARVKIVMHACMHDQFLKKTTPP